VVLDSAPVDALVTLDTTGAFPRVRSIEPGGTAPDAIDVGDALILPAPLDLHFHGCGEEIVPPAGSTAHIDTHLADASAAFGWGLSLVGAPAYEWVATLPVPSRPPADPVAHLADAARDIAATAGTSCAGLRIEGLFLNPSRAGVWPPETFRAPDLGLLEELVAAARESGTPLRILDVAPELDGCLELIERARELGVIISLAHTDATWEQAVAAIDSGATLATHAWNAMRPIIHRDPGVIAAVLTDPRVTCELICDGVHLHAGTIALSIAASGAGGWVAVSDASPFAGAAPGPYKWAGTTVHHDGIALRDDAGRLAGSASLLDRALVVLAEVGVSDLDAHLALGADPRRVLDPARPRGLVVGDPVWVVSVD